MPTGALSAAAAGLMFQQNRVHILSDNIANMSTAAFKRAIPIAVDQGYQNFGPSGTPTSEEGTLRPAGSFIGLGVRTAGVVRSMEQGDIEMTDNPLDLMIQGEGWFQVEMPNGDINYTRDGRFMLSAERQLVTIEGYKVLPTITIPQYTTNITINKQGEVYATIQGNLTPQLVGQLELAVFPNPKGLDPIGNNLFKETTGSGVPTLGVAGSIGYGTTMQYAYETSNVKPLVSITELIDAQRAYSMNTKSISAVQTMNDHLDNLIR